jgi:hypothetical protein
VNTIGTNKSKKVMAEFKESDGDDMCWSKSGGSHVLVKKWWVIYVG